MRVFRPDILKFDLLILNLLYIVILKKESRSGLHVFKGTFAVNYFAL